MYIMIRIAEFGADINEITAQEKWLGLIETLKQIVKGIKHGIQGVPAWRRFVQTQIEPREILLITIFDGRSNQIFLAGEVVI